VFDLSTTLDDKTREILQIYHPLIAQNTGLPAVQATTAHAKEDLIDGQPKPSPSVHSTAEGEEEAPAEDVRTTNVLIVDDNEVNLRVRFPFN
jgi:hypothetical protein